MSNNDPRVAAVLEELDGFVDAWADTNHMRNTALWVSNAPLAKRAEGILALLELAYAEGYYHGAITRPVPVSATS